MDAVSSSSPCALASVFVYGASCIALSVLSVMGIPYTSQSLGALMFLSAFPLLWLVERRAARMTQLILEALRHASTSSSAKVDSKCEGQLLLVSGTLAASAPVTPHATILPNGEVAQGEKTAGAKTLKMLCLQRWGVDAPDGSVAIRAHVESYRRVRGCSCDTGWWYEGGTDVPSLEARADAVLLGAFLLVDMGFLDQRDAWVPFTPALSERYSQVLDGAEDHWTQEMEAQANAQRIGMCPCCNAPMSAMARRLLANPLPFPGERPHTLNGGTGLYYARGGGNPARPMYGDVRISFLHVPGGDDAEHPFTALGVQRGRGLEPFRFLGPPPSGISADGGQFNHGPASGEYEAVDSDIEAGLGKAAGRKPGWQTEPPWLPSSLWVVSALLKTAWEGWRIILHRAAPETLLFCTPGTLGRCAFFLRADGKELWKTWRLRFFGFLVMMAGTEVAFWKWQAFIMVIPYLGTMFADALWLVAIVGAAGFTLATVAVASLYYRPISALLYLTAAVALFATLFGQATLLTALAIVGVCMAALLSLFLVHLILPC